MNKLEKMVEQLIPFLIIGIAMALVIGVFIMLSYVIIWGIVLGAIIWVIALIKNHFFPSNLTSKKKGRIIEHHDLD